MNIIRKSAIILILLLPAALRAQTTVTGTIVDANSNPYANGTVSAYYLPSTGQGAPFTLNSTTNSLGFFSIVLKSTGAYQFTVCAMPVNIGPLANPTPTQICAYSSPIQISGGSQDVSSQINAGAPILGPKVPTATGNLPAASSRGQVPAASGPGNTYLAQSKLWIDVRDGFGGSGGVDCTGAIDATATLQLMINNAPDYSSFHFPQGCKVTISGSPALTLDQRIGLQFIFEGRNGNGCAASNAQASMLFYNQSYIGGNKIWYINRSQSLEFRNMTIWTNGGADTGIDLEQVGATPPINTRNDFYNVCIYNNQLRNASWQGVAIGMNSVNNTDNQHFYHLDITCSSQTPTSISSNGHAVNEYANNPKNIIIDDLRTTNCSQDIENQGGSDFTMINGLSSSWTTFNMNGFNDAMWGVRSEIATHQIVVNGNGPHLIEHSDFAAPLGTVVQASGGGCGILTLISNNQDISPSQKTVDCVGAGGTIVALNNRNFNMLPTEAPGFVISPFLSGALSQTGALTNADTNWISVPFRVTFPSTTAWGSSGLIFDTLKSGAYDHFVVQSVVQNADSNVGLNINYVGSNVGYIGLGGIIPGMLVGPNTTTAPPIFSISPRGTFGITTWSYLIQAITSTGHSDCSSVSTIVNGNATLSGSNTNVIIGTPFAGAVYYNVYRTVAGGTPNTTGLIGKIIGYTGIGRNTGNNDFLTFTDNGLAGDGSTCPVGNTTGTLVANGGITDGVGRKYGNVIGSGSTALNTNLIASQACDSVVTVVVNGVVSTDTLRNSLNGDVTGVTGYAPLTTGTLTIYAYPSVNAVNFKVCNSTSAGITPGAVTLNWQVIRGE